MSLSSYLLLFENGSMYIIYFSITKRCVCRISDVQRQTKVTAYFSSKQLLLSASAGHYVQRDIVLQMIQKQSLLLI